MPCARATFATLACLLLLGCVIAPSSRTALDSANGVMLKGFTGNAAQVVTIQAIDQNTGNLVTLGTATTSTSGSTPAGTNYTLYPWTYDTGVLAAKYWAPQSIADDLKTSQGHLELLASIGTTGQPFYTFSPAAANSALQSGKDPVNAGAQYTDGNSTVLLDQNGVNNGLETPWVNVTGMVATPPGNGYPNVAWSVGYYTVESGKKIYGLICTPVSGGPNPVIIFNHGGTGILDGGGLNGKVTTDAGGTAVPALLPDSLGQCIDWAKRGWIFATTSYRGEVVNVASTAPTFPGGTWTSDGDVEFCLGEVNDVMALTDLLVNQAAAISVGSGTQKVTLNSTVSCSCTAIPTAAASPIGRSSRARRSTLSPLSRALPISG